MTKAEIVEHIYERVGFSKKESAELVEKVFEIIKGTLAEGEKVKISGFGNFVVREKNARKGRNPQTGEEIRKTAGSSLRKVTLFDRYEGRGVPEGKVSLAFRLEFQRAERTLTDAEVSKSVDRVVARLAERFGGELR